MRIYQSVENHFKKVFWSKLYLNNFWLYYLIVVSPLKCILTSLDMKALKTKTNLNLECNSRTSKLLVRSSKLIGQIIEITKKNFWSDHRNLFGQLNEIKNL